MPENAIEIGDPRLPNRFWLKVSVQPNGCWQWAGAPDKDGYGTFYRNGRNQRAHRVSYGVLIGPIPAGLEMDHLCHTRDKSCDGSQCKHRSCVNPSHLEPVTRVENNRRNEDNRRNALGQIPHATRTHCPAGHEYTAENTYMYRQWRQCRACNRACAARYAARKRAERPGATQ